MVDLFLYSRSTDLRTLRLKASKALFDGVINLCLGEIRSAMGSITALKCLLNRLFIFIKTVLMKLKALQLPYLLIERVRLHIGSGYI